MSLISLYQEKKTALGPPVVNDTYQEAIFEIEANGTSQNESLVTLYEEDKSALDAEYAPTTYEESIFNLERAGKNSLLMKNQVDPTFRAPLPQDTYTARLFKENAVSSRLI